MTTAFANGELRFYESVKWGYGTDSLSNNSYRLRKGPQEHDTDTAIVYLRGDQPRISAGALSPL